MPLISELEKNIEHLVPGQSIDCVVIGFEDRQLKVLLLKWKDQEVWSLPGGFINKNEHIDDAAYTILKDRTNLEKIFLSQFYTFGRTDRRDAKVMMKMLGKFQASELLKNWLGQRFITIGYLALVKIYETDPKPDGLSEECSWISIKNLPNLAFDHKKIIEKAIEQIRIQLNYLPIGQSLLPPKFTMGDLQKMYESIFDRPLDRGNFQKKMLKSNIFNRHEKHITGGAYKAPYLYSYDDKKYKKLIESGIGYF